MKTPAPLTNQAPDEKLEAADRLDSWKEIAAYLKRDVRTVRRWEKSGGLPVRRHLHQRQASVFAYRSELDAWWQNEQKGLEQPETASEAAARPHAWKWGLALAAALILLCLAVYLADRNTVRASAPGRTMLAVLPFQNLGGGNDKDYICDGLTEDLGTELTMLDPARVGVIARTSSMTYKGRTSNVRDIGRELGVQYVIEGSVRFGSERSRVNVQLIRVADQSHVWAQSFEALPGEMFALEQDIARRVAGEVDVRLNQAAPAKPREAVNPDAYRLYLQGRELWGKRSQADLEHSIELYQEALKFDPRFARAYGGIADSFNQLGYLGFRPLGYTVPEAQRAAQKALELDPTLAQAHAATAFINAMWVWDWNEAESQYLRAIELDPGYVPAHHFYALFLAAAGRLKQADDQMSIAVRLDPLAASVKGGYAYILFFERQYAPSLEYARGALESDPGYEIAYAVRGWDLTQLGRYDEAIAALQQALELAPENSLYVATLGRAYVLAGRSADAEGSLRRLEALSKSKVVGASMRAIIYTAMGDKDNAFRWLNTAMKQEDGFLLWMKVTPEFDALRPDVRFEKLLSALKLP